MSVSQFYQDGGAWMHVITLLTVVAAGAIVGQVAQARRMVAVSSALPKSRFVPRFAAIVLLVGTLAVLDGFTQVCAALRTVPEEQWGLAALHGAQLAIIPGGFALACAILLLLAYTIIDDGRSRIVASLARLPTPP